MCVIFATCHVVCHLCFGGVCFAGHMEAVGAYHPLVGHRGANRWSRDTNWELAMLYQYLKDASISGNANIAQDSSFLTFPPSKQQFSLRKVSKEDFENFGQA